MRARLWLCGLTMAACGGGPSVSAGDGGNTGGEASAGADASAGDAIAGDDAALGEEGAVTGDAGGDAGGSVARKRGVAYGSSSPADLAALSAGIGWWYNWSPQPDATLGGAGAPAGVEFVPMIWGGTFDPAKLATQVPAGAKYLLTFNEPNFGAQSNLTPQAAAALWPKVEAFAQPRGMKIVSPALNYCGGNCNETNPFTWLDAFFAACTGCQVDYIGAHWYACTKSALTGYLSQYETKYGKPLWVTEFSCLDSSTITTAIESTYMNDALTALEADPMVFRYSWFTGRSSSQPAIDLLGASGTLTPLGQQYVAFPEPH